MINKTTSLLDLVKVYNAIPKSSSSNIIKRSADLTWYKHSWSGYSTTKGSPSANTEFLRAPADNIIKLQLIPIINECLDNYKIDIEMDIEINGSSHPQLNKYDTGTMMLPHHDHIHSLFSGPIKGIPILSIVGLLNDDFEGGEFVFWNDELIKLVAGDVLIFPSLFAYEHQVNKITKGSRYSFVSWTY
jgi:predicted 2-oxoglutarate/Fe(II)-dependent dioxygenase YbiX